MKIIEDITVKVTYTVGLGGLVVSPELYEILSLMEAKELNINHLLSDRKQKAMDWLSYNIREKDARDWSCEIEDLKVIKINIITYENNT